MNEFIWNNKNIAATNRMLFNSKLFLNGVWYVSDLLEKNVLIPSEVWLSRECYNNTFIEWARIVNIGNKKQLKR